MIPEASCEMCIRDRPKGLIAAALANTGERFGFYTMMAILTLFLMSKFGIDGEQAGKIYSFFYTSIYILALVGGLIADRLRNYKGTIIAGILVMTAGYAALMVPTVTSKTVVIGALMVIAFGNGLFKGCLLYTSGDALTYLTLANRLAHDFRPSAVTIAEDVSGMPGMCIPIADGGIGFDYRLGMAIPDFWIKQLKEVPDEQWDIREMWSVMTDRLPEVKTVAYAESHDQALVGDKTIAFRLMDKEMYFHMDRASENIVIDRGMALHKICLLYTSVSSPSDTTKTDIIEKKVIRRWRTTQSCRWGC